MEKYINKEDLGEMITAIASCAVENAETLRTEIRIDKNWNGNTTVKVSVRDEEFKTINETEFVVINASAPANYADVILDALRVQQEAKKETSENKEE